MRRSHAGSESACRSESWRAPFLERASRVRHYPLGDADLRILPGVSRHRIVEHAIPTWMVDRVDARVPETRGRRHAEAHDLVAAPDGLAAPQRRAEAVGELLVELRLPLHEHLVGPPVDELIAEQRLGRGERLDVKLTNGRARMRYRTRPAPDGTAWSPWKSAACADGKSVAIP